MKATLGFTVAVKDAYSCSGSAWLDGRPAAYFVGHLALEELPVGKLAVESAVLHDDLAMQDRRAGPCRHHVPLPRRVVGLVQVGGADRLLEAGLQQHDVGVGA